MSQISQISNIVRRDMDVHSDTLPNTIKSCEVCTDGTSKGAIISFDSGSYSPGVAVPPLIFLTSAIGNAVATNTLLGNGMYGPELAVLGAQLNLSPLSLPPWPQIITRGGIINEWAASIESIVSVDADTIMSLIEPSATLPEVYAELWHAPAPTNSPTLLFSLNWQVVPGSQMSLGQVQPLSLFGSYRNNQIIPDYPIYAGDYLLVRLYINSNIIVTAVAGCHASATVNVL